MFRDGQGVRCAVRGVLRSAKTLSVRRRGTMTITLLGQAGLYFKLENGVSFMLDPYLSDSLRQKEGECFARRVPLDGKWLEKSVDMLLFTHDHADHFDMESISPILDKEDEVSV